MTWPVWLALLACVAMGAIGGLVGLIFRVDRRTECDDQCCYGLDEWDAEQRRKVGP